MKNKNVILSIAVLLASVGTALATAFYVPVTTYVHGFKVTGPTTEVETCSTLTEECNTQGNFICKITVSLRSSSDITPGYQVESGASCTTVLRNTSDTAPVGTSTVFDSVDDL